MLGMHEFNALQQTKINDEHTLLWKESCHCIMLFVSRATSSTKVCDRYSIFNSLLCCTLQYIQQYRLHILMCNCIIQFLIKTKIQISLVGAISVFDLNPMSVVT